MKSTSSVYFVLRKDKNGLQSHAGSDKKGRIFRNDCIGSGLKGAIKALEVVFTRLGIYESRAVSGKIVGTVKDLL